MAIVIPYFAIRDNFWNPTLIIFHGRSEIGYQAKRRDFDEAVRGFKELPRIIQEISIFPFKINLEKESWNP